MEYFPWRMDQVRCHAACKLGQVSSIIELPQSCVGDTWACRCPLPLLKSHVQAFTGDLRRCRVSSATNMACSSEMSGCRCLRMCGCVGMVSLPLANKWFCYKNHSNGSNSRPFDIECLEDHWLPCFFGPQQLFRPQTQTVCLASAMVERRGQASQLAPFESLSADMLLKWC
jgi:hypothetical protein